MKKLVVIAVLMSVLAGAIYAQAVPGVPAVPAAPGVQPMQAVPGFVSPQGTATQGRLRSAADDFIRPDSYAGVAFEKWYSMASFASTTIATLGYAAKIGGEGGLYLGVFYSGMFWANVTTPTYTTEQREFFTGVDKNVPIYNAAIDFDTAPSNQIAVLIGVADMGFRLSFITTYESFKTDGDTMIAGNRYKSYEKELGLLSPQIAWSMAKNLTDIGIKPWATFDLGFNRAYEKTELYTTQYDEYDVPFWIPSESSERIVNSQNNIAPEVNIGLGGITIANKDSWRTSTDLEYRLQIRAYNNEYNYDDIAGNINIKSFNGTYFSNNTDILTDDVLTERSFNGHRIRPIISTQWNGDKLRLRAKLDLNLIFSFEENNPMVLRSDNSGTLIHAQGRSVKTSIFSFNPVLQLAAQWQAASKFFLNIGGHIELDALRSTTTEGSVYDSDGNKEYDANGNTVGYKTSAITYGDTQNQLTLGVTINATDNLGFEANAGVSINSGKTELNFFDTTDGLFVFGSILVSLKF